MTAAPNSDFWQRVGLDREDGAKCLGLVRERYDGCRVEELGEQGYCSFTLLVSAPQDIAKDGTRLAHEFLGEHQEGNRLIVQIRPSQHALDMNIARAAKETFSSVAPVIRIVDLELPGQLRVYEMQKMRGTPLSRLLPRTLDIDATTRKKQERLVASLAALVAHSWPSSSKSPLQNRNTRADSPMEEDLPVLLECTGKVGSSTIARLQKLGENLPDQHLRDIAKTALAGIKAMEPLPVVLNHGDLIPSNILVDEDTWEITGLVDWAEAEYLPFGTCLYGLEHVFGYLSTTSPLVDSTSDSPNAPLFMYHEHANSMRELFWTRLCEMVPDFKARLEDVKTMRDIGVLLWYGFAWDGGAIDRVVNEMDDSVEVVCLRAFFDLA
jgi:hypothetical protein